MLHFLLAYLGGLLTLLSPCILPVLPFVFTRVGQPFARNGLPLLAGMALAFVAVASLGAVAGAWAASLNQAGRWMAMAVLAAAGAMLLFPALAERCLRPLAALGAKLSEGEARSHAGEQPRSTVATSLLVGVATGLLWAPCAGPVLGLILGAAMIEGPTLRTSLLLLGYAAGAATSLALVLGLGGRAMQAFRAFRGWHAALQRGVGAAVLAGVVAVALGLDSGALARLSAPGSEALEHKLMASPLLQRVQLRDETAPRLVLPVEGRMPPLDGAVAWFNGPPLTAEQLRGKVVLVDFWTFGCITCRNALLHVREWHRKYKDQGLVVVGVHTPEFAYEKNIDNVKRALTELDVPFPVAVDNGFAIWRAFDNRYWPAHYFVDAQGRIRFHHFGEGEYAKSEQVIRQLLDEARKEGKPL